MEIEERRHNLGKRIRRERQSQGFTQRKFAAVVGLGQSYISEIERGESSIGFNNLCKVADALGVSVAYLVDFEGEIQKKASS